MSHEQPSPEELSRIYHALRASRRRRTIEFLWEDGVREMDVRTVARRISSLENNVDVRASSDDYRNVYNALSQTHLETLDEADIVDYDSDRQKISSGPHLMTAALFLAINRATFQILHYDSFPKSQYPEQFNEQLSK